MSWFYSLIFFSKFVSAVATRVPDKISPTAPPSPPWREVTEKESQNAQGVVELDLQRVVRRRVVKRQEGGFSEAGRAAIGLGDALDITYNVLVEVGNISTPLVLDTGSADLWVLSSDCYSCFDAPYPLYSPDNFQSVADARLLYGDSRTGTHAFGLIGSDRAGIAGLSLEGQYFAAINDTNTSVLDTGSAGIFGLGFPVNSLLWDELYTLSAPRRSSSASRRYAPRNFDLYSRARTFPTPPSHHFPANLGVGENTASSDPTSGRLEILPSFSVYGPLVSRLILNRQLGENDDLSPAYLLSPQFSVTLQRTIPSIGGNAGTLTLGALPSGVDNNSLVWSPVRRYNQQQNGVVVSQAPGEAYPYAWEIPLDAVYFGGVRLNNSTLGDVSKDGVGHSTLIDTGNSLIRGPADVIIDIVAMLVNSTSTPSPFAAPGSLDASAYSEEEYASFTEEYDPLAYAYPCEEAYLLEFEFSGRRFPVDPRDFGRPLGDAASHFCIPNLAPTDPPLLGGYLYSWSIGEPFLRGVLASFYYGNLTHPSFDPPRIGFVSTVPEDAALRLEAAVESAKDAGGYPETTIPAPNGVLAPESVTMNSLDIAQASEPATPPDIPSSAASTRLRLGSVACILCLAFAADVDFVNSAIFCAVLSMLRLGTFA